MGIKEIRPWNRFWARIIDSLLFTVGGNFIDVVLYNSSLPPFPQDLGSLLLLYLVLTLASLFIEACVLSTFGTTPGKLICDVVVTDDKGKKLSFDTAFKRSWYVYFWGEGLNIPFIQLFTYFAAYDKLKSKGVTHWDEKLNLRVITPEADPVRITIFILTILFANSGVILFINR